MTPEDFFRDGILIYLSYLQRKYRTDSDYPENKIVMSLICAVEAAANAPVNENVMGVSDRFITVIKKLDDGFEIMCFQDAITRAEISIVRVVELLSFQVTLDREPKDPIKMARVVELFNDSFDSPKMVLVGDRADEAIDEFYSDVDSGKLKGIESRLPGRDFEPYLKSRPDKPWKELPPELRQIIGIHYVSKRNPGGGAIAVSSHSNQEIKKKEAMDMVTTVLLGGQEYIKTKPRPLPDVQG